MSRPIDFDDLSSIDDVPDQDEGIEGDDLDEHFEGDYRPIPELDQYDPNDIDNGEYSDLDINQRRDVDRQLNERDGYNQDLLAPSSPRIDQSDQYNHPPSTPNISHDYNMEDLSDNDQESPFVNLDEFTGPLREWIALDGPRREIRRRFRAVLIDYEDKLGEPYYSPRIASMCADFQQSLHVSYCHISTAAPILGIWLADCPSDILELFDEEATAVVMAMFPEFHRVHETIYVRITDLPVSDNLRDLRQVHLNALVRVSGVVTRRTSVFPQLLKVKYDCGKCGVILGPYNVNSSEQEGEVPFKPSRCPNCDSNGPFNVNQSETVYRNYQRITLQESPGSVPAGRVPRTKEVIFTNDLRDCVRPGEQIDVTGIYKNNFSASLNSQHGFPVFSTVIEANYILKRNDQFADSQLSTEDREEILALSREPDIAQRLISSIAPAIYGHDDIRIALALALFGGCAKQSPNAHRIRGDINVLLLGDPGTAKSQFLKYVEHTSPRAVFTTGKGASAVGLTACVRRDPISREWTLEGGALVLADSGHCLIDEFDKMNEKDRTSIHEAMEQQSISISKAGIITTLQARCSVIAAANPIRGRYDSMNTFAENVELTDPILSRFDILCVVRDLVDPVMDERLALHVVDSHIRSHPENHGDQSVSADNNDNRHDVIPQEMLRKYIQYSRLHCKPSLISIDHDKISQLYVEMRQQSVLTGGIPISVRHVESILRMAEAHAKMHLRDQVMPDDVNVAIRTMLDSFIGAQKFDVKRALEHKFSSYMQFQRSSHTILFDILNEMIQQEVRRKALVQQDADDDVDADDDDNDLRAGPSRTGQIAISLSEFESRAARADIDDISDFCQSSMFNRHRFTVDVDNDRIIRLF